MGTTRQSSVGGSIVREGTTANPGRERERDSPIPYPRILFGDDCALGLIGFLPHLSRAVDDWLRQLPTSKKFTTKTRFNQLSHPTSAESLPTGNA